MVSIAASNSAPVNFKGKEAPKGKELKSLKDITDTVDKTSKSIKDGAQRIQDVAKNTESTVTACATALTTSAGSIMAAGKVFKPFTNKVSKFMAKPGIQKFAATVSEKATKLLGSAKAFVKANPKATAAIAAVIVAATAAIIITKAVLKSKAEIAEKTAAAKSEPAAAPEKKLDVVSEA